MDAHESKIKRRWYQYSLRTLLIVVTLSAIACSWFAVIMQQAKREREAAAVIEKAKRQREAAAAIEKSGGSVTWSVPGAQVAGKELVVSVIEVSTTDMTDVDNWQATDSDLKHIKEFSELRRLNLCGGEKITSVGLENLKGLRKLEELDLTFVQLTDNDLENIKELDQLRILKLNENYRMTDAGLEHVKGLSQLGQLELAGYGLSKEGIKKLQQALPKCQIIVTGLPLTRLRDSSTPPLIRPKD